MLQTLSTRLQSGAPLIGSWLFLGSPITAEIMSLAGFDLLFLDTEHSPGDLDTLYHQLRAVAAQKIPVIVRVDEPAKGPIKRALDAGAAGVALSDLQTAADAEAFTAATRYAPRGTRGTHRFARAADYGLDWLAYSTTAAAAPLTVGLIESAAGVAALDSILAVDTLDVIFIGSADLAASVGRVEEPQHPEVLALIDTIETKTLAAGKTLGGLAKTPQEVQDKAQRGYRLLTVGSDALYLRDTAVNAARGARDALD